MLDRNAPRPSAADKAAAGDKPSAAGAVLRGLRRRRTWKAIWRPVVSSLSSSVSRRIVLLNFGGLLTLLLGFLWLNQTRDSVIDARVQSLFTQAEIISAAIAASASVETGVITIDPDKLLQLQAGESGGASEDQQTTLEFSINPERVAQALKYLVTPTRNRARLFDREGNQLLDTKAFYSAGEILKLDLPAPDAEEFTLFERSWNAIRRRLGRMDLPAYEDTPSGRAYQEVGKALQGITASIVRVNANGQTIVSVAVPVKRFRAVQGALMLTTQEGDIDKVIADERLNIFFVFSIASGVMLVLSLLLAGTIAQPLRKLAEAAERVRRGTRSRQEIPDFSDRSDEIGHLSGALRDMTRALYNRIEAIESFAADVAHELKNPLTSLRSAVETMPLARSEESKSRLLEVIQHDVQRLDRLITDISSASRLDAELARGEAEPVDLARLLEAVVALACEVRRPGDPAITLTKTPDAASARSPFLVMGHDSRLVQVFNNLIDNARSFSPDGGTVCVLCRRAEDTVEVVVEDDGPGIPDHALDRIFERFYTDRPDQGFGQNSGLGLSISKQIIEAHQGEIRAENRKDTQGAILGARFVVSIPALQGG